MADTTIEWCDRTWNPVRGCSRVSPGCDNCYAMRTARRFSGRGAPYEGLTTIRRGKVDWTGTTRFVPDMLDAPLRWRKPARVFVNSMSDLFHESLPNEQIAAVFGVMAAAPRHTFIVVTKRPKRMREWFEWFERGRGRQDTADVALTAALGVQALNEYVTRNDTDLDGDGGAWDELIEDPPAWPLPNVWILTSVEDQTTADVRIPYLQQTPAAVRGISFEPMLGPVDLAPWLQYSCAICREAGVEDVTRCGARLDWVILGGESGAGARECDTEWIRAVVEQCRAAGVPCFVKQLGARPITSGPWQLVGGGYPAVPLRSRKGGDPDEWPEYLRVRQWPEVRQ